MTAPDPRIKFDVAEVEGGWLVRGSLPVTFRKDYRTPTMTAMELAAAKDHITSALRFHEQLMTDASERYKL